MVAEDGTNVLSQAVLWFRSPTQASPGSEPGGSRLHSFLEAGGENPFSCLFQLLEFLAQGSLPLSSKPGTPQLSDSCGCISSSDPLLLPSSGFKRPEVSAGVPWVI